MTARKALAGPRGSGIAHSSRLHDAAFCVGLGDDDCARLDAIAHLRRCKRGATILAEGEEGSIVGSVLDGVLRMRKSQADGRQQIVGLLAPPAMFGHVFSGGTQFALEAATDATLLCFDKKRFEALLLDHPRIEHRVMLQILDELDAARDWITLLGAPTVAQRFAGFLLMLCQRWPALGHSRAAARGAIAVEVPIGRADLAQYLGTTAETISRTVRALARAGLIEVVTPAQFVILDIVGLVAASGSEDFDPAAIRAATIRVASCRGASPETPE